MTAHGTYAAAQAHRSRGERPCPACMVAAARYIRAWRNRNRCARGLGWPLQHESGAAPAGTPSGGNDPQDQADARATPRPGIVGAPAPTTPEDI